MRIALAAVLCLLLAPAACGAESRVFFAMDTVMTISAGDEAAALCEEYIARLEKQVSVTDPESAIYALNAHGTALMPDEARELLEFALDMCADTGGALDITLYPVAHAWGFTTGEYRVPDEEELAELLRAVDHTRLVMDGSRASLPEGAQADLGSVAKGWAADGAAEILRELGEDSAIMDLGGCVYCVGEKPGGAPWRVGLRDPGGEGHMGVVEVRDRAVVTSGCYERYFEEDGARYGHIFDPETGRPADSGLASVTVIGESAAVCDALSTALYVMGPDAAMEYLRGRSDVRAVLVGDDGAIMASAGLRGVFTPAGGYENAEIIWFE